MSKLRWNKICLLRRNLEMVFKKTSGEEMLDHLCAASHFPIFASPFEMRISPWYLWQNEPYGPFLVISLLPVAVQLVGLEHAQRRAGARYLGLEPSTAFGEGASAHLISLSLCQLCLYFKPSN